MIGPISSFKCLTSEMSIPKRHGVVRNVMDLSGNEKKQQKKQNKKPSEFLVIWFYALKGNF